MPDNDVMQKEESELDVRGMLRTAMGDSTCWRIVLAHVRGCGEGVSWMLACICSPDMPGTGKAPTDSVVQYGAYPPPPLTVRPVRCT
eukprot:150179-Chlamydomonas_euryale.AAC.1